MRVILVSILVTAGLGMSGGSPACARETDPTDDPPMHRHLATTVEKIRSGVVFFKPAAGLQQRAVSVHKAERMGLNEAKEGDEVILIIDESNLLIDLHRKGVPPAGHRLIGGRLTYADPLWEVIEITNAEGKQTFAMDDASGSKLSLLKEGKSVMAELNEDNLVVDIHPAK